MSHNADPVLILTRPAAAAARFVAEMGDDARGIEVFTSPVIGIEPLAPTLPDLRPQALILTSENGAMAAARMGLGPMAAHVVGPRTEEVARSLGFRPHPPAADAEELIARLVALHPPGPLLHVRGEHASGAVGARLTEAGIPTLEVIGYAQRALPPGAAALAALSGPRPVVLPLFSPRSAALVIGWGRFSADLHIAAISPAVAARAVDLAPRSMVIAETPDGPGMIEATAIAMARARTG
ncbi:MAG: uroporphyrinogen-III synthase [Rubellimicrobium sp.]|nr:uroporphyrinogen-III synthase [Rubellimicrobium sp.]